MNLKIKLIFQGVYKQAKYLDKIIIKFVECHDWTNAVFLTLFIVITTEKNNNCWFLLAHFILNGI